MSEKRYRIAVMLKINTFIFSFMLFVFILDIHCTYASHSVKDEEYNTLLELAKRTFVVPVKERTRRQIGKNISKLLLYFLLNCYYKTSQYLITKRVRYVYYKTSQIFITKRSSFFYYKMSRFYYKTRQVLQKWAVFITKLVGYYKNEPFIAKHGKTTI